MSLRCLAALTLAALLVGCGSVGPSIHTVRRGLEQQVPYAHFEQETQITLGRVSLGLAKKLIRLAVDKEDEEELAFLWSLKKVEVGVYNVRLSRAEQEALTLPRDFERALNRGGWEALVKTRDGGERTWVFLRPDGEALRSVYVVTYDGEELVLVHVEGRLDLLLRELAEDDPEAFADVLVDEFG